MKTLNKCLEDWLTFRQALRKSPGTLKQNRHSINVFISFLESRNITFPSMIRAKVLREWQIRLSNMTGKRGHPLSPVTINGYNYDVRTFLGWLAKNSCIPRHLIDEIHYIKAPKKLPGKVLTHKQMQSLLNSIPTLTHLGYRNRTMLEVLYSSGLRASELLNLDTADIDFSLGTLTVTGKGNKTRVVPTGQTALRFLETWVRAIRPFLLENPEQKAMFLNKNGKRLGYRSFLEWFTKHSEKAGFKNITPHTFRRSCTTELIRAGANIYHVSRFLGHDSPETLSHYTKLTINDLKKTHEKCHPGEINREKQDNE